jgi:hypothetical protein
MLLLVSQMSIAQLVSQKKANYYFSKFSYSFEIPKYEKMIKSDFKTEFAHQQLADCFLKRFW